MVTSGFNPLIVLFLTSKWDKFQTQTKFSLGKKPFLSTLCCMSQNFHKKINFLSLKSSYHRLAHKKKSTLPQKKLQNLKDKLIGTVCFFIYLMLKWVFPDKTTPDFYFTDEAVVQCYVSVVEILL